MPNLPSNSSQYFDAQVFNGLIPPEGPKVVPLSADFSAAASYTINFLLTQSQQFMSQIVSVFVDNSTNDQEVSITVGVINQVLKIPAHSQAYLPLFAPKNTVLTVASTGAHVVGFFFVNVPLPAAVWGSLT